MKRSGLEIRDAQSVIHCILNRKNGIDFTILWGLHVVSDEI